MKRMHQNYKNTEINTASKEKILLLLYEGAIKFVKLAKKNIEDNNVSKKGMYIGKSISIISELMNSLSNPSENQVGKNLENLYTFMINKLINANINNQIEDLQSVEKILMKLYNAWKDVIENTNKS